MRILFIPILLLTVACNTAPDLTDAELKDWAKHMLSAYVTKDSILTLIDTPDSLAFSAHPNIINVDHLNYLWNKSFDSAPVHPHIETDWFRESHSHRLDEDPYLVTQRRYLHTAHHEITVETHTWITLFPNSTGSTVIILISPSN
jgi:hypothetical protein